MTQTRPRKLTRAILAVQLDSSAAVRCLLSVAVLTEQLLRPLFAYFVKVDKVSVQVLSDFTVSGYLQL